MKPAVAAAAALLLLCAALGASARAEPPRVVVYDGTQGYHHSSIEPGDAVLEDLAADGAFEFVAITSDAADFTPQLYQRADVFLWNSATGEIPLSAQQKIDLSRLAPLPENASLLQLPERTRGEGSKIDTAGG